MKITQTAHTLKKATARRLGAVALGLTLATSVTACGADSQESSVKETKASDSIQVEEPWVRATEGAKDTSMTAAFMVIDNQGTDTVRLVGASSDVAGRTEIHEMVMKDGKSLMQELEEGLEIRANSGQLLQPGGTHVMLMDVKRELAAGDEVKVELEFSDGSTATIEAPVKAFTEEEGHYHAPGTGEHSH